MLFHADWSFTILLFLYFFRLLFFEKLLVKYCSRPVITFYPKEKRLQNEILLIEVEEDKFELITNIRLRFTHVQLKYKRFFLSYNDYIDKFIHNSSNKSVVLFIFYKDFLIWYNTFAYFKLV